MGDDTIKKNISRNIGKYREANGMSQKELAKRLGVVPSRISNWETGANCPTIDILFEVCEALNVSINDIYGVYPNSKFVLQYDEINHIKKYRDLDQHGKETVSYILNRESERVKQLKQDAERIKELTELSRYVNENTSHYVNAAHPIDGASEDDKQFDEDIMNDENF